MHPIYLSKFLSVYCLINIIIMILKQGFGSGMGYINLFKSFPHSYVVKVPRLKSQLQYTQLHVFPIFHLYM